MLTIQVQDITSRELQHFGIIIDEKLYWKDQVELAVKRSQKELDCNETI